MLFRSLKWNVVSWFPIVSAISYTVIIAGILMMGYNFFTKGYPIKLGLSFTGGTDVTAKYVAPVAKADIQRALAGIGRQQQQQRQHQQRRNLRARARARARRRIARARARARGSSTGGISISSARARAQQQQRRGSSSGRSTRSG